MQGNSREESIYLAGIFDGEGSIMVVRQSSPSFMKHRLYPYHGIVIRIGMIDQPTIESFYNFLGYGELYEEKPYHHKRPMFRYSCRRKEDVKRFLEDIGPFLRIKKDNVETAFKFIDQCTGQLGKRITPEMNKLQHDYYIKMRALNGIDSPATTERMGHRGRSKGLRCKQQSDL